MIKKQCLISSSIGAHESGLIAASLPSDAVCPQFVRKEHGVAGDSIVSEEDKMLTCDIDI